ncbi:MAG TPA: VTT domain-containing protein [Verrucomicrobiota bacterium]|nr:VTT domain-containing protein [Verrucomicrobiota bacterium]
MATMVQERDPAETRPPEPAARPGALLVKALLFLAIAIAGIVAYRFTPLKEWLQPAGAAADWVRQTGFRGVAAFFLVMALLIVVGVPRLLFCPLAGALFGFWGGMAMSVLGTMASYYAAFLVIRGRRHNTNQAPPLHPKLAFLADQPGLAAVIVSRMLPVPGMVATVALALSNVRTGVYLAGSLVGLIPEAVPLVLLGAGVLHSGFEKFFKLALAAFVCILAAWVAIHCFLKHFKPGRPAHQPQPAPQEHPSTHTA